MSNRKYIFLVGSVLLAPTLLWAAPVKKKVVKTPPAPAPAATATPSNAPKAPAVKGGNEVKAAAAVSVNPEAKKFFDDAKLVLQEGSEDGASQLARAVPLLNNAIAKDPSFTEAYLELGAIYENQMEWGKAIDTYRAAAQNSLDKEKGFAYLGKVYGQTGRTAEATKILDSLISRNPYNITARNILAAMKRRSGDLAGAEKILGSALSQAPNDVETFKEVALLNLAAKRNNDARLALLKAMKIKESDPAIANISGLISLSENDLDKAVEHFRRSTELDSAFVPARLNLSSIFLSQGYFKTAQEELAAAYRIQPRNSAIMTGLGITYRGLGDNKNAEAFYKKALSADPGNALATYDLGILYYKFMEQPQAAATYFKSFNPANVSPASRRITAPQAEVYLRRIQISDQKQAAVKTARERSNQAFGAYQKTVENRQSMESRWSSGLPQQEKAWGERRTLEGQLANLDKQIDLTRDARQKSSSQIVDSTSALAKKRAEAIRLDEKLDATGREWVGFDMARTQIDKAAREGISQLRNFQNAYLKAYERYDRLEGELAGKKSSATRRDQIDQMRQVFKQQENIDRRFSELQGKLAENSRRLNKVVARLQEEQGLLKKAATERAGADTKFALSATDLKQVDARLTELYKELRQIDESRSKLEGEISESQKKIVELDQKRMGEEKGLTEVLGQGAKLEEELLKVDRKREAFGAYLEQLEELRKNQLVSVADYGNQLNEHKVVMQEYEAKRTALETQVNNAFNKINQLETRRGQTELQLADLIVKRSGTQDQVGGQLAHQKRLDEILDDADGRRREMDVMLPQINAERIKLAEEEQGVLRQMQDLLRSGGEWVEKSRPKGQSVSSAELKSSKAKEYLEALNQVNQLYKQSGDLEAKRRQNISNLSKAEKDRQASVDRFNNAYRERMGLQADWQQAKMQRQKLEAERGKGDQSVEELRKQRQNLEGQRRRLEGANRQSLDAWVAGLQERHQLHVRGLQQYEQALILDGQRQQWVSQDLLRQFLNPQPVTNKSKEATK